MEAFIIVFFPPIFNFFGPFSFSTLPLHLYGDVAIPQFNAGLDPLQKQILVYFCPFKTILDHAGKAVGFFSHSFLAFGEEKKNPWTFPHWEFGTIPQLCLALGNFSLEYRCIASLPAFPSGFSPQFLEELINSAPISGRIKKFPFHFHFWQN